MLEAANTQESAVASSAGANQREHRNTTDMKEAAQPTPTTIAAADQVGGVGGDGDPQRADHGKQRQRRHRAARAVAVEPHADRHLHREQREEEGAARPAELARAEAEIARQLGRDHAVGDAVELAEAGDRRSAAASSGNFDAMARLP